jgi:DNA-directed RNA polymerase specialized sigma24 family protein
LDGEFRKKFPKAKAPMPTDVLLLKCLRKLTNVEIAKRYGCSLSTIEKGLKACPKDVLEACKEDQLDLKSYIEDQMDD